MSLLNQSPDEFELVFLRSLEKISNTTVEYIVESATDPVIIVVVVVCAVGAVIFCLCMIRCVSQFDAFVIFFIFLKHTIFLKLVYLHNCWGGVKLLV